jgi:4,5-dihydroxyphthalate decarboxylase
MADLRLSAVSRSQGNNVALKSGQIELPGISLEWIEIDPLVAAFRRMVRATEFDVCEMAITTYLCAKEHGKPFTALPIPLVRDFHHSAIHVLHGGPVAGPKDLEGTRVGINRGYTVTTGVWARGILHEQYGVDLGSIEWVLSGDEHVAEYRAPANVTRVEEGEQLIGLLRTGDLSAVIGVTSDDPDVVPLIPAAEEAAFAALETDGLYPINHVVVVRDELLSEHPDLGARLFEAFAASKRTYVDDLRAGRIDRPTRIDRAHIRVMDVLGTEDPLPYGVRPNLPTLERILRHAKDQHILTKTPALDEVFARGTMELVG